MAPFRNIPIHRALPALLLALGVAAMVAACSAPQTQPPPPPEIQTRCTLTYAGNIPNHTFTVGQPGSVQGSVLVDGDCGAVVQSMSEPLPSGLTFSVDWGGRRWTISGTPTETAGPTQYTIQARAVIGSGPADITSSRKVELTVVQ